MMRISFRKAEALILKVALEEGIQTDDLLFGPRTKTIGGARQKLMRLLREQTDLSWREIGMVVGRKGKASLSHNPRS